MKVTPGPGMTSKGGCIEDQKTQLYLEKGKIYKGRELGLGSLYRGYGPVAQSGRASAF